MTAQSSVSSSITRADEKWDADGQRVESKYTYSSSENTNTMSYDALGNRVRKFNPSVGETIYVYDAFGNLAAEYDPVGSVRLVVDQNQAVVRRYDTMPFGEQISAGSGWANGRTGSEYQAPGTVKWRFAGGYKDDQAGEWPENVVGARQYYPGYGRFITPDDNLADQHPGDPLSWNLFAYVRNNPLRYWDPTGTSCKEADSGTPYDDGDGAGCAAAGVSPTPPGKKVSAADVTPQQFGVDGGLAGAASEVTYALTAFATDGPKKIDYEPNNAFAQSFRKSIGMDAILEGVTKDCRKVAGRVSVGSGEAFVNGLIDGILGGQGFYNPHFQLGAFNADYRRDSGGLAVKVTNPISVNSALYHATSKIGISNPRSGPFGTVHQTIHLWMADPCRAQ